MGKRRVKGSCCKWIPSFIAVLLFLEMISGGMLPLFSLVMCAGGGVLIWPLAAFRLDHHWQLRLWAVFAVAWFLARLVIWISRSRGTAAASPIRAIVPAYCIAGAYASCLFIVMFLSSGHGQTYNAEVTRIIYNARNVKAASLILHEGSGVRLLQFAGELADLDTYVDAPLVGKRFRVATVAVEEYGSLIGIAPVEKCLLVGRDAENVRKRLVGKASPAGLLDADGRVYAGKDVFVFMTDSGWRLQ